jgi:opacity protein-like surface antigen
MSLLSGVASASDRYQETYYKGPEAYLEFAGGFVSHHESGVPYELDDGAALAVAVGMNKRLDERFSHGFKVTVDTMFDANASCRDARLCGDDEEQSFSVTSLGGNYDLDWRFARSFSLLASVGAGPGWSDFFEDDVEIMVRASVGLGFHVSRQLQLTLAGTANMFPFLKDNDDYHIISGMFGLRWAWDS